MPLPWLCEPDYELAAAVVHWAQSCGVDTCACVCGHMSGVWHVSVCLCACVHVCACVCVCVCVCVTVLELIVLVHVWVRFPPRSCVFRAPRWFIVHVPLPSCPLVLPCILDCHALCIEAVSDLCAPIVPSPPPSLISLPLLTFHVPLPCRVLFACVRACVPACVRACVPCVHHHASRMHPVVEASSASLVCCGPP